MSILKHLTTVLYSLLFFAMVALAAIIGLSSFDTPLKLRVFTVLSGSMEPAIATGSLVFVRPQETYFENEVITVISETNRRNTVTHRVTEVIKDDDIGTISYRLKGDANEEADRELIPQQRVVGKVSLNIPFLGKIINTAQTPAGFVVLIVIPATIIAYSELMSIKREIIRMWKENRRPRNQEIVETHSDVEVQTPSIPKSEATKSDTPRQKTIHHSTHTIQHQTKHTQSPKLKKPAKMKKPT